IDLRGVLRAFVCADRRDAEVENPASRTDRTRQKSRRRIRCRENYGTLAAATPATKAVGAEHARINYGAALAARVFQLDTQTYYARWDIKRHVLRGSGI